jgi:hypothetical protein
MCWRRLDVTTTYCDCDLKLVLNERLRRLDPDIAHDQWALRNFDYALHPGTATETWDGVLVYSASSAVAAAAYALLSTAWKTSLPVTYTLHFKSFEEWRC